MGNKLDDCLQVNQSGKIQEFYNSYAKDYDSSRNTQHFKELNQVQLEFLQSCVNTNWKILEVGCGTGEFLQHFPNAKGIDFAPKMVLKAREKGLKAWVSDATNLPFKDREFEFAYSFKVLAHIPEWKQALSEMARVSKYGIAFDYYSFFSTKIIKKQFSPKWAYTKFNTIFEIQKALDYLGLNLVKKEKFRGYAMVFAVKQR